MVASNPKLRNEALKAAEKSYTKAKPFIKKANENLKEAANEAAQKSPPKENISDIFLPHKICNDLDSPDAPILISFPGIKHPCNKNTYLINLNPKLPSNFQDFKSSYQLVIEDGGEYQKIARESFKVCLEYGIKPNYIG